MKNRLKLAVFASGSGTNLQSLIDRSEEGRLAAEIKVVVSDRDDAYALQRARAHNIPHFVVDYGKYLKEAPADPAEADLLKGCGSGCYMRGKTADQKKLSVYIKAEQEILDILRPYSIDYVCLAGFMRLLTPFFLHHFRSDEGFFRIINIHPALLPSFPGRHGYEDTFNYGCKWGGVTVHFVDEGEDTGPIITQMVYPIFAEDTIESIRNRGLKLEYELYAQVINWLAKGMIRVSGGPHLAVTISDPTYKDLLKRWLDFAFS